ncbi:hypothetical protein L484_004868 [Morus notabilis]|uniref:Uncharacterized protein n=1 Tax=Morus notabilis TaxID=981085 RepID=W9QQD1_9ROSA|nr:hypothetical protein L484_004868 [Morus notabilis]
MNSIRALSCYYFFPGQTLSKRLHELLASERSNLVAERADCDEGVERNSSRGERERSGMVVIENARQRRCVRVGLLRLWLEFGSETEAVSDRVAGVL